VIGRMVARLGSGVAGFFLVAFIVQVLWKHLVMGYLGLQKPLSYWQAAELLFLVALPMVWAGSLAGGFRRPKGFGCGD